MSPEITITTDGKVYCQRVEQRPRLCPHLNKSYCPTTCPDCHILHIAERFFR